MEQALDVDRAAILVVDADGVMRFKAWRGLSDVYRRATEGHSPWPSGARDPEPVFVTTVRGDASLNDLRAVVLAEGIEALAFFPLLQAGRLLGNYPQALSHVSLVNTARNVSRGGGPAQDRHDS